jgi:multicomponent Na+:H+ antiporter subunit A
MTTLLILLLLPLGLLLMPRSWHTYRAPAIGTVMLAVVVLLLTYLPRILQGDFPTLFFPWIPDLGIHVSLCVDGLGLAFSLLIAGLGGFIFIYAGTYMRSYNHNTRFFLFLTLFSLAMMGMVLSSNLILLFIFWELTTVLSFLLITFFHEKEKARLAGFQSLFITVLGGLSLLAGIILLGTIPGSYQLADWISAAPAIKESPLYLPGLILILIGVFTKSAQFPFHFWLPAAMQAPAPVSAYLHSATMVKAGFFLLLRLQPILGGTDVWHYTISFVGVLTMLFGAYFAITQTDLKATLAYTTINALGVLILLVGIDTSLSIKAAILFLFVHALYKATLFMIAGYIEKKTGTRDLRQLGGLRRQMPIAFIATLLAALSMAGFPPMLGFIGKELIYEAQIQLPGISGIILVLGVIANILMVAISLYLVYTIFFGKFKLEKQPAIPRFISPMLLVPVILSVFSLVAGLMPDYLGNSILKGALLYVIPGYEDVKLKLWHGFNPVLWLSMFTAFTGISIALIMIKNRQFLLQWQHFTQRMVRFHFADLFLNGINNFVAFVRRNDRVVNHGYHRIYLLTFFLIAAVALWVQMLFEADWNGLTNFTSAPFYLYGIAAIMVFATALTVFSKSRLAAIISMGVIGYGIAFIYLFYSAVDLAITQILAETLVVVLFVLILQRIPAFAKLSPKKLKNRDMVIAVAFGAVMTLLALQATDINMTAPISEYFVENSLTKAFGKNVVNVILVDFRALDTMGEVIVLIIAALGVFTLLSKRGTRL